ncbi:hypothetical protein [Brevundimonas sp. DS20]|uniref:hypothetical protein n=1 Tax=Brevundimonas sp. DS20 TaxID=1532555 RepID=UPI0012E11331|nr:hypothetical protein [Brevundimonas sp. DS20]
MSVLGLCGLEIQRCRENRDAGLVKPVALVRQHGQGDAETAQQRPGHAVDGIRLTIRIQAPNFVAEIQRRHAGKGRVRLCVKAL